MSAETRKQPRQTSKAEDEIRATLDAWSAALEAKDAAGLVADYAPDAVLFDLKPPFQVIGRDNIRRMWEQCLPYFPNGFKSERRDLMIAVDGDVAFLHCLHRIKTADPKHPAGQSWLRVTVCYRRLDGKWRAVHEHVSLPYDPRSGQVSPIVDPDAVGTWTGK